jgi:hypothetical protein
VELPANEWKSYLEEADHPEYPSASACFCNTHAQSSRRFLGTDTLFCPAFGDMASLINGTAPARPPSEGRRH